MSTDVKTATNFVKGRITETIFRLMMEEDPKNTFTLLPFGYENSLPQLAQFGNLIKNRNELALIRQSPDFILMKDDKSEVHFVEVKYRVHLTEMKALKIANDISKYWPTSYVFIATQEGFYFDQCQKILESNGKIAELNKNVISSEIQEMYLNVLKSFIKDNGSIFK